MKPRKMLERLQRRIRAHAMLASVRDEGPRKRFQSGGYRVPGSPKQN